MDEEKRPVIRSAISFVGQTVRPVLCLPTLSAVCRPLTPFLVLSVIMIVMSLLRPRLACPPLRIPCRWSGHGHGMDIKPSEYTWHKFKDMVHFYVMLGLVPVLTVSAYKNLTEGPAVLTETPEGYEPSIWEYEKYPMNRLFARGFANPAPEYERKMYLLMHENEKMILDRIENQVKTVMSIRNDFQAWYYEPMFAKAYRHMRDLGYRHVHGIGYLDDEDTDLSSLSNPER